MSTGVEIQTVSLLSYSLLHTFTHGVSPLPPSSLPPSRCDSFLSPVSTRTTDTDIFCGEEGEETCKIDTKEVRVSLVIDHRIHQRTIVEKK